MKEVFKCDYCNYIGTAEDVAEHEKVCLNNPDVKCCYNCQYAHKRGYIISGLLSPDMYTCSHHDATELDKNTLLCISKPLPDEEICEYYKRGKPYEVIPV